MSRHSDEVGGLVDMATEFHDLGRPDDVRRIKDLLTRIVRSGEREVEDQKKIAKMLREQVDLERRIRNLTSTIRVGR